MIKSVLGFLGGSKVMLIAIAFLATTTTASAYLLKQSYKVNGQQKAVVEQSQVAIKLLEKHSKELDRKLLQRERKRNQLQAVNKKLQAKLAEVKDETNCIDRAMPDDLRMLFIESETDNS